MFPGEHGQVSLGIYLGGICWNTGHECSPNKIIQLLQSGRANYTPIDNAFKGA